MRNAVGAICYRCGTYCKVGDGFVEIVSDAHKRKWPAMFATGPKTYKWLTQHAKCADKYRGTTVHFKYDPDPETKE